MNFPHFSLFEGDFFAFFSFSVWFLWNLYPFRENSLRFSSFQDEFSAVFNFQGWILCIFHPFRVNFLYFFPLKVNSLQFLPFKDEFFAIFTLQGWNLFNFYLLEIFFGRKGQNYSYNGELFLIFFLFKWLGFSIWNSACVLLGHKSPVFFWVICWHFLSFKRVFFTIFTFLGFFGMKMDKKFSCNGECFKILIFA